MMTLHRQTSKERYMHGEANDLWLRINVNKANQLGV